MPRPLGLSSLRILGEIRRGKRYGLEIVTETGLPSGTVYPGLGRLKKRGLVTARWEASDIAEAEGRPRRRYYELTEAGRAVLAEGIERLSELARELDSDAVPESG